MQGTGLLSGGVEQYLASCRIVSMDVCCPFCMRRARPPAAYPDSDTRRRDRAAQVSTASQRLPFCRAPLASVGTDARTPAALACRWPAPQTAKQRSPNASSASACAEQRQAGPARQHTRLGPAWGRTHWVTAVIQVQLGRCNSAYRSAQLCSAV